MSFSLWDLALSSWRVLRLCGLWPDDICRDSIDLNLSAHLVINDIFNLSLHFFVEFLLKLSHLFFKLSFNLNFDLVSNYFLNDFFKVIRNVSDHRISSSRLGWFLLLEYLVCFHIFFCNFNFFIRVCFDVFNFIIIAFAFELLVFGID